VKTAESLMRYWTSALLPITTSIIMK